MTPRNLLLAFVLSLLAASGFAADWPQWCGPNRDGVSKETGLLQKWPEGGPKLLWMSEDAGIGLSGPAIVGNLLFTLGADKDKEYLIALDIEAKGKQAWKAEIGPIWTCKDNIWGDGPRSTPTVDGDRIYALGGQGIVIAYDMKKKAVLWRKDLVKEFGGKVMEHVPPTNWGFCESVLVDGDQVVCCPGGNNGLMLALNKLTGATNWQTKDIKGEASDGSMVAAEIGGVRQYVQTYYGGPEAKNGGCLGVEAKTGKVLWNWVTPRYDIYSLTPTPIVVGDAVCLSANQAAGTNLLKITKDDKGAFQVEELYTAAKQKKTMSNTHGGMVLVDKHLYGYAENDGWTCQNLETGEKVWKEKRKLETQKSGALTYADGHLYLLTDKGEVALVEASPKPWIEHGRFKLPKEAKSREELKNSNSAMVWTHPVVSNGRLYIRDQELMFCYDVKK